MPLIFKLVGFNVLHILLKKEGVLFNSPHGSSAPLDPPSTPLPQPCSVGPEPICPVPGQTESHLWPHLSGGQTGPTPPGFLQVQSLAGMERGGLHELKESGDK